MFQVLPLHSESQEWVERRRHKQSMKSSGSPHFVSFRVGGGTVEDAVCCRPGWQMGPTQLEMLLTQAACLYSSGDPRFQLQRPNFYVPSKSSGACKDGWVGGYLLKATTHTLMMLVDSTAGSSCSSRRPTCLPFLGR